MERACVFAHFDKNDKVDEYVYYYLNQLQKVTDIIIFVTVSDITSVDIQKLQKLNIEVIKRKNEGYDFYSYKVGLERLHLNIYDELILCNDSVYGPIFSIKDVFETMKQKECDFWGITASKSISYHMQSYFMVYRKNLLHSVDFFAFWNNVKVLENKVDIVKEYEVGSSVFFFEKDYVGKSYIENVNYETAKKNNFIRLMKRLLKAPSKIINLILHPKRYLASLNQKHINTSLIYWDRLLLEEKMPFIKISLFTNHQDKKEHLIRFEEISQSNLLAKSMDYHFNPKLYEEELEITEEEALEGEEEESNEQVKARHILIKFKDFSQFLSEYQSKAKVYKFVAF